MSFKWTLFVFIGMFGCSILFTIVEQGTAAPQATTILSQLDDFSVWTILNPVNVIQGMIMGDGAVGALISAALFDYKMFETGAWELVRYFFLMIGVTWLILTSVAVVRGVSSA